MPPALQEYSDLFNSCVINPAKTTEINGIVASILLNKNRYQAVSQTLNSKMPWWFVGVIHSMECSLNFGRHLHNGDPLTARTVRVPEGRPMAGSPPFTWEASAIDALRMKLFHLVGDWSISNMLYLLEKYNGMGYRSHGINTPYLWSRTNHYSKGKYVSDGRFDPEAVSGQVGAAALIKTIQEKVVI